MTRDEAAALIRKKFDAIFPDDPAMRDATIAFTQAVMIVCADLAADAEKRGILPSAAIRVLLEAL